MVSKKLLFSFLLSFIMVQAAQAAIDSRSRRFMSELWPHLFSEETAVQHKRDWQTQGRQQNINDPSSRYQSMLPDKHFTYDMPQRMPDINMGRNISAKLQQLKTAIENGDLREIQKLLNENPSLIEQRIDGKSGPKPFLFAIANNPRLDILKMLLFAYGANINELYVYQPTPEHPAFEIYPLNEAILKDFPEKLKIIEFLLQNGADAKFRPHKSLLHYVLNQYDLNLQLISLLIKYSKDLNVQNRAHQSSFDRFLERIDDLEDRRIYELEDPNVFPAREFKETIKTFLRHDAKRQREIKLSEKTQQLLMEAQKELAAEQDQAAVALMLESPRRNTQFAATMNQLLAPQSPKSQEPKSQK